MAMSSDLPDPAMGVTTSNQPPVVDNTTIPGMMGQTGTPVGNIHKEVESAIGPYTDSGGIKELGADIELPKEVAGAGVKVQPVSIPFQPPVSQLRASPPAPESPQTTTVAMPLTDQQIAQGLKQGVSSSWRWLAEWCVRRLKQLHGTLTGKR